MSDPTVSDFMARMGAALIPGKAAGIDAAIQLALTGAQAANWFITIKDGQCTVDQGIAPAAKLTVSADSTDFIKIFSGQMDGMQAFMQGKLKVSGDMGLAMKLMGMFKLS